MFSKVYDAFFRKITEDMYMELTKEDTENMVQELLLSALSWFEFPRVDINDYDLAAGCFNVALSLDEINIISTYMVKEWLGQQLASVENTRMKYSGSDFKFTSQANHMAKLKNLKEKYEAEGFHLQRLYKRRKRDVTGIMKSTLSEIMGGKILEYRPEPETPSPDDPSKPDDPDKCCCNEIEVVYGGDADPSDD